jgi:hypothetical protein
MEFWTSERRGAAEIATFSNPPHNYIGKPRLDELAQLVAQWRDPSIRAVVIQSRTGENSGFTQYSVEELYGMASDPALSRYAGAVVRSYKAMSGSACRLGLWLGLSRARPVVQKPVDELLEPLTSLVA